MIYEQLINDLAEIVIIAKSNTVAAAQATKILQKEVTSHNTQEITTLLKAYHRNR